MAVYNQILQYTFRDSLAQGDPQKTIKGAYFDGEFQAIHTASLDAMSITQNNTVSGNNTFTGTNLFTGAIQTTTSTSGVSPGTTGGLPGETFIVSTGAADSKLWREYADTTSKHYQIANDTANTFKDWLVTTRSANVVTNLTFGNSDNPTFTFSGSGLASFAGPITMTNSPLTISSGPPILVFNATGGALDTKNVVVKMNSGVFSIASSTDAAPTTSVTNAIAGNRSGTAWTSISLGNATDNPSFSFLGTGLTTYSGGITVNGLAFFPGNILNSVTTAGVNVGASSGDPVFRFVSTNGAANTKAWQIATGAAGTALNFQVVSDDWSTTFHNWLTVTRSAAAVSNVSLGNGTDNPSYNFNGSGAVGIAGTLSVSTGGSTIKGALTISAPSSGTALGITSTTTANALSMTASGNATNGNVTLNFDGSGNSYFYNQTASTTFNVGSSGATSLLNLVTSNTGRVTINSTGNVTVNAPSSGQTLTVNGATGGFGVVIQPADSSTALTVLTPATFNATINLRGNNNAGGSGFVLQQDSSSNAQINNQAAGSIIMSTNGSQRVVTNSSGNVTINAPSSGTALTITSAASNFAIDNTGPVRITNSGANLLLLNNSGAGFGTIQNDAASNWSLGFTSNAFSLGTSILKWNSSGNVTIAPPSSGNTLTVAAINGQVGFNVSNAAGAAPGYQWAQVGQLTWQIFEGASSDTFHIWNSSRADVITITGNGNISIAAPSSGQPLSIAGTTGGGGFFNCSANTNASITADFNNTNTSTAGACYARFLNSTDSMTIGITSTGYSGAFWTNGPTGESVFIGTSSNLPLSISTFGKERIRASGAGNVTVNAPDSGTAATISGLTGQNTLALSSTGAASNLASGWNAGIISSAWNIYSASTDPLAVGTQGNATLTLATNNTARMTITGAGQAQIYEPSYSAAALKNAATEESGTFTGTLTGMTAGTTGTVNYRRVGGTVTLFLTGSGTITGTSNATSMTMTGIPASLRPNTTLTIPCGQLENNASSPLFGSGQVDNTGTITFALATVSGSNLLINSGAFTASGTKGLYGGWTFTYPLS